MTPGLAPQAPPCRECSLGEKKANSVLSLVSAQFHVRQYYASFLKCWEISLILQGKTDLTWYEVGVNSTGSALCGVTRALAAHRKQNNALTNAELNTRWVTLGPLRPLRPAVYSGQRDIHTQTLQLNVSSTLSEREKFLIFLNYDRKPRLQLVHTIKGQTAHSLQLKK